MSNKSEVLLRFRSAVEAFDALIRPLSVHQIIVPGMDGWSVRDMLGHFAGYHEAMALVLEAIARGEPPPPPDGLGDDEHNAIYADEARSRPAAEVLAGWREAFEHCYRAAAALPEERFDQRRGARRWLLEEADHYDGHAAQVKGWLGLA